MRKTLWLLAGLAAFGIDAVRPAEAEPADEIGAAGFKVVISPREHEARFFSGDKLIALAKLPGDAFGPPPVIYYRAGHRYGGWAAYNCHPRMAYYCFDDVHGYGPGYAVRQEPRQLILSGKDLAFVPLAAGSLPEATSAPDVSVVTGSIAYDPLKDHWRILYEAQGSLKASPGPFISTAELLRPLAGRKRVAAAVQAPSPPVLITITALSRQAAIADHQRILNLLGYHAGAEDGVLGLATRTAIARFEVGLGFDPTGRLTARNSAAIYRAAGVSEPLSGRLAVTRDGETLADMPVAIEDGNEPLGTNVLMLDAKDGIQTWQMLTLAGEKAQFSELIFGNAKGSQKEAAMAALDRVDMSAEVKAQLAELAGPGSILTLSEGWPAKPASSISFR